MQAAAAAIGYLIANAPNPLFLTALTFVAAFIPTFTGHPSAAIFVALWGLLVVSFVDNLAKPYLMKDRMESMVVSCSSRSWADSPSSARLVFWPAH